MLSGAAARTGKLKEKRNKKIIKERTGGVVENNNQTKMVENARYLMI